MTRNRFLGGILVGAWLIVVACEDDEKRVHHAMEEAGAGGDGTAGNATSGNGPGGSNTTSGQGPLGGHAGNAGAAGAPPELAGAAGEGTVADGGASAGAAGASDAGSGGADSEALTFTLTPLGDLQGFPATSFGLNDAGDIVGRFPVDATTHHPFLWKSSSGELVDLGRLGTTLTNYGEARGINNSGLVVGAAFDGGPYAFTWVEGGTMVGFDAIAGANAVNDAGQVAARRLNSVYNAYRWDDPSQMRTDLGSLETKPTNASFSAGINQAGDVVGGAMVDTGQYHGFLWQEDVGMVDLGTLATGATTSVALGINDMGQVVGHSFDDEVHDHACLWQDGEIQDLGYLSGNSANVSQAEDINDTGQVVGYANSALGERAILWTPELGMVDLNTLLAPGATTEVLSNAPAINEVGQIVCNTTAGNVLLLTPSKFPF